MVVLAKYNLIRNMIHKIVLNSFVILQRLENNTNIWIMKIAGYFILFVLGLNWNKQNFNQAVLVVKHKNMLNTC